MPLRELWQPPYRGRTLMLVVFHLLQTIGLYGFANWAPTFLLKQGKDLGQSLEYGFLIALVSPLGPLLGVLTAERIQKSGPVISPKAAQEPDHRDPRLLCARRRSVR